LSAEDQHILAQLKQSKVSALEVLHKKYAYQLYKVCRGFYLTHEDAEEIVQDIFLKIWNRRNELKLGFSFRAYLFTIAKNDILKFSRKKVLSFTIDNYIHDHAPRVHQDAENMMIYKETEAYVAFIINSLPPQKQKIYILSRFEGLSHEQIAEKLGISIRTVENHTYQTNLLLKKKMGLL
jgi:RNA polymerase sigma-70 factor (ECF subfamily)